LFGALMSQCRNRKSGTSEADTASPVTGSEVQSAGPEQWQAVIVDKSFAWPGSTDPFTMTGVRINGDTLLVDVNYGGGCEEHEFTLTSSGTYLKSLPPQVNLWLQHENKNDMCRALIYRTLRFDLRPIRYDGLHEIKVIVNEDRPRMALYKF
jgi:hypothetical protein